MKNKTLLTILLLFYSLSIFSQAISQRPPLISNPIMTPGRIFDIVFDQFGHKYNLDDLQIRKRVSTKSNSPMNGNQQEVSAAITFTSCTSGYFKLYFETGSGMEGNTPTEISRRDVICQVFYDISQFINSPLTANGGLVNIFIRDIVNMGVANPSIDPTMGLGATFYSAPLAMTSSTVGGIADNMIWQTITSGTDAYINTVNPICTPMIGGGNYYHGMVSFNFSNPFTVWHTQLTSLPGIAEFDLYSIALHEITHSMGFGSLIDQNGESKLGILYPYYSRYDKYLKTQSNIPLIAQTTNSCTNSMYTWNWNPSLPLSILQPGFTNSNSCIVDNTICNSAINFNGSIVQPVYTPNCYSSGSTLSHFEDQCSPALPGNNLYFVMANANGPGPLFMKRYFTPEERYALCDMGYACGTVFGNPANLNNFTYNGSACLGAQIAGLNDGINSLGFYNFIGNLNTPISLTGMLSNDVFTSNNGNTFKCLEVVIGSGTLSNTSGISSNYTPLSTGIHLLRYIPLDGATGKEGNITYIFVFVQSGNCVANACNIINNGGFENATGCSQIDILASTSINCWNNIVGSCDLFVRGCIDPVSPWSNVPTFFCSPPSDTWNNGASNNDNFLGMFTGEGAQTQLSSSLIPNTTYNLSFWARIPDNYQGPPTITFPVNLYFGAAPGPLTPTLYANPLTPPSQMVPICVVQVTNNNSWNYYSVPISFTTNAALSYFSVINAIWTNTASAFYLFLDDISIIPASTTPSFTSPPPICRNQAILDLNSYVTLPGGIFSGPGVTQNNITGLYEFNANLSMPSGQHIIAYSYTLNNCPGQIFQPITVSGVSVTIPPRYICSGSSTTLIATGADSYAWSTGATSSIIVVSPTINTVYTVTATSLMAPCAISTQTSLVRVFYAGTSVTPVSQTICAGQTTTLEILMPNPWGAVSWLDGSPGSTISVSPSLSTTYYAQGLNGVNYCASVDSGYVYVLSPVTASINPPSRKICFGQSVQMLGIGALSYSWSSGGQSPSVTLSPTVSSSFVLHGYGNNGSCHTYTIIYIQVEKCTGIEEVTLINNIKIFPNPFIENLSITSDQNAGTVDIILLNMVGQIIYSNKKHDLQNNINLVFLSPGIYILKATMGEHEKIFKILKE